MNTNNIPLSDVYQRVTDAIIEGIERGAGTWTMPWHCTAKDCFSPVNAATRRAYRGVNVLSLWCAAQAKDYPTGYWATYRQWEELGAHVRKGEKATLVVFWKFANQETEDDSDDDATQTSSHRAAFARGYSVFNAAQVDGFELPVMLEIPDAQRNETAERFFAALGADIRHGGNRAYFSPTADYIQMPPFEAFKDVCGYYSTLGHEATHWVGGKPRLNRDLSGRFGNAAYAAEELVAELGSAFISADLNLTNEPRPDHAAYVNNWLGVLRKDKRAIFTAASKAQQAVDWMHGKQVADLVAATA